MNSPPTCAGTVDVRYFADKICVKDNVAYVPRYVGLLTGQEKLKANWKGEDPSQRQQHAML